MRAAVMSHERATSDTSSDPFLRATDVIDHDHRLVQDRARLLAAPTPIETARRTFEWVRDSIRHTGDHRLDPVTCSASEVLATGTGYSYAKAHLLVALCRANGVPAALAYQRVRSRDRFTLHGLAAVRLPEVGWYRCDPRGEKPGVHAGFAPPVEQLAFANGPEAVPVFGLFPDPLPEVLAALRTHRTRAEIEGRFPDLGLSR
jgi:transglutaminase-like putative cysteine protease